MVNIEHWIGVRMAAGYDRQDFIDACDRVAGMASIEQVEIRDVAPDTDRGAVERIEHLERALREAHALIPVIRRNLDGIENWTSPDTNGGR